jgi:hypothetical protein
MGVSWNFVSTSNPAMRVQFGLRAILPPSNTPLRVAGFDDEDEDEAPSEAIANCPVFHTLEREDLGRLLVALEPRCDGESENFFSAFSAGQTQPSAAPFRFES